MQIFWRMVPLPQPKRWQLALVLTVGVLAVSTAAILVRLASAAAGISGVGFSLVLAAARLNLAAIVLLPTWQTFRVYPPSPAALRFAGAAGIALAVHFATWITSLSYTSIAASTALVTTNPVWVALLSWGWFGEKLPRQVLFAIGMAFVGGLLIGLGGVTGSASGSQPLLGDGLALLGAFAASLYFLLGWEAQKQGLSVRRYVTVAYSTAAIVLLPLPLLVGASYVGYPPITYAYILLMALLPQLVGHTSFNWAIRWVSPTLVALVILFEPVISSLLGYLIFGEIPGLAVFVGALLLLSGVTLAVLLHHQ